MSGGRWNPWKSLRDRAHLTLRWAHLDGLLGYLDGNTIVLHDDLDRVERNAVLAHELVHEERGGGIDWPGMPPAWSAVVAREELLVDREVAERLIPQAELEEFVRSRGSVGPVTIGEIAVEFDVPEWIVRARLVA